MDQPVPDIQHTESRAARRSGVRPEAIRLGEGTLQGCVEEIEPMGRETLYLLETPLGPLTVLTSHAVARFGRGDNVPFTFRREDTLLFDARSERRISGVQVRPV